MSEWIKCADQMPLRNQSCIVYRCDIRPAVPCNMYWDGGRWTPDGYGFDVDEHFAAEDVSHWQPLPQPPTA
jgi:hypothetical protein